MSEASEDIIAYLRDVADADGRVPRGAFTKAAREAGVTRAYANVVGKMAGFSAIPASVSHGTHTMYVYGCRCEPCVGVKRAYSQARWQRQKRERAVARDQERQLAEKLRNQRAAIRAHRLKDGSEAQCVCGAVTYIRDGVAYCAARDTPLWVP